MKAIPFDQKDISKVPRAIWSSGNPTPHVYHGTPIEMVRQIALEIVSGDTSKLMPSQAIDGVIDVLAQKKIFRIHINGNPPDEVRAGILIYALLQHGLFLPMAQA